jgi:hypothetical protein
MLIHDDNADSGMSRASAAFLRYGQWAICPQFGDGPVPDETAHRERLLVEPSSY